MGRCLEARSCRRWRCRLGIGGDAAGGPLGADADPKLPLESADGEEAESVRARLRERVSSPCGDDEGAEPAGHPPATRRVAAVLPPLVPLHLWSNVLYMCVSSVASLAVREAPVALQQ